MDDIPQCQGLGEWNIYWWNDGVTTKKDDPKNGYIKIIVATE